MKWLLAAAVTLLLASCASAPKKSASESQALPEGGKVGRSALPNARKRSPYAPAQEDIAKRGNYTAGGLYAPGVADSAPDEDIDVDAIPEPVVDDEPHSTIGNRTPYAVLGKQYRVLDSAKGYDETGTASFYGNKFHGRLTSNREVYDMYAFTAAHKTLPLPSFARVTNLDNGQSVVVRVNDRGPFHDGRIIDLSYAAAVKLGVHRRGTARVEVVGLVPGENARIDDYKLAKAAPTTVPATGASVPTSAVNSSSATQTVLPPGVHIATGKPRAVTPSAIDALVNALPIATANASERPPPLPAAALQSVSKPAPQPVKPLPTSTQAATPIPATSNAATPTAAAGNLDWRFDMSRDGKAMSADEFDRWMKSRRARVATGKSGTPDPYGSASPTARIPEKTAAAPTPKPAAETEVAARRADSAPAPAEVVATVAPGTGVTLQVAAFGARANAERALAMLQGAGVGDARLSDGQSAGKPVWRLRVGPVAAGQVDALSTRVAGLGFGKPQVVRE